MLCCQIVNLESHIRFRIYFVKFDSLTTQIHATINLLTCFDQFIAGEWWKADPEAVIRQALQTGAGPNVSEAYTINGLPGPLYNCSKKGIYILVM